MVLIILKQEHRQAVDWWSLGILLLLYLILFIYLIFTLYLIYMYWQAVDWWSLGILIYEMLFGLPPFYNRNTRLAYEKLLTKELEFPHPLSQAGQSLLQGLLTKDPTRRLGSKV